MDKFAQENVILGNCIEQFGYCGVYLAGWPPGEGYFRSPQEADVSQGHTVRNNRISDGDQFIGHGAAVYLYQSGRNTIRNNEISRMKRYGISLKGINYSRMRDS